MDGKTRANTLEEFTADVGASLDEAARVSPPPEHRRRLDTEQNVDEIHIDSDKNKNFHKVPPPRDSDEDWDIDDHESALSAGDDARRQKKRVKSRVG